MTNFPIDVTTARLIEFHGLADALCQQELGRLPSHTPDDPVAEIIELLALQGNTGEQIQAWLHDQPEAVAHRAIPPLPPIPTREQVCNGQTTQQGLIVTTAQWGAMPWWGACWAWLSKEDRAVAAKQLLAHGDTICLIERPSGVPLYDEMGNFYSPDRFPALSMSDADFAALIDETLRLGFSAVWVFLGGDDGERGFPIAVQQVQALMPALGSLAPYVAVSPGWDGVFYGYTPQHIADFAAAARAAGALYVMVEHQPGRIPVGNGPSDYAPGGLMTGYDVILGEFSDGVFDDTVWQVLGRMVRPYVRPADEPSGDDPHPPFYLAPDSPRGPYFYRIFEFGIYGWVRGTSPAMIQGWRDRFAAMAPGSVIC